VQAAKDTIRILIRRPHAYKFRQDHAGTPIPGLVLLDVKGSMVGSARLPARGGVKTLLEIFAD